MVPKPGGRRKDEHVFRIGESDAFKAPDNNSNSRIEYFFPASFKNRLTKVKGFKSLLSCCCHSAIPRPILLAYVVSMFLIAFIVC